MFERARATDTLAVLRGVGPRVFGAALVRRARAALRDLNRAAVGFRRPPIPEGSPWWAAALRAAPSPLARSPLVDRGAIRQRARAALSTGEREIGSSDPRLSWEPGRGARLLRVAAGLAVEPDGRELRRGFERLLFERLSTHRVNAASDPLEASLRAWTLWNMISMAGEGRAAWDAQREVAWPARFESFDCALFLARRRGLGGDRVSLRAGPCGLKSPRYGDIAPAPAVVARRVGRVELPMTIRTVIRRHEERKT